MEHGERTPWIDETLTPAEAARELGLSVRTLSRWRTNNEGPPYHKIGHSVYYATSDLRRWIADKRTSEDI